MTDQPVPTALVMDYGGVLTGSLADVMGSWLAADGLDPATFQRTMRAFLGDDEVSDNPVHALERGEVEVPDFEQRLAGHLTTIDGGPVPATGLLTRMFAGFTREDSMVAMVRRAKKVGVPTALLSNSWGVDYPREGWAELFDVVVISGEVGMRKPERRIYDLVASRLDLPAAACVMVDDLRPNVRGAVAAGMVGVLHTSYAATVLELEALLGMSLRV